MRRALHAVRRSLFPAALGPVLCALLCLAAPAPPCAAEDDQCAALLEWEVVFGLAHDELMDYLVDESMDLSLRIRGCDVFTKRLDAFLEDYPSRCDTRDDVADLKAMKDDVAIVKKKLESRQPERPDSAKGRYN